jgi:hypothetical protein
LHAADRKSEVRADPDGVSVHPELLGQVLRRHLVANDLGDSFTLVDRTANTASVVPVAPATPLHGFEPSTLAFDPTNKRLWVTLVILEDDASQGGEHVDQERSIVVLVSPWVKRGYVSKTHIDGSSVHKIFAHVFGIPYENELVANSGLPLDMFTSTPDYTPFTYSPRTWPLECGPMAKGPHRARDLDEDTSFDAEITRWMRSRSRAP